MNITHKRNFKVTLITICLIAALIGCQLFRSMAYATGEITVIVSNQSQLMTAISAAQDGDVIGIQTGITISGETIIGDMGKHITLKRVDASSFFNVGSKTTFQNITLDGGGISASCAYVLANSNMTFQDVIFQNCTNPSANGGAVYLMNYTTSFTNCTFKDNTAVQGGHIYIANVAIANLSNCTLKNGHASSDGGAIRNASSVATCNITSSIITGNAASKYGGGISNNGRMTITTSKIYNNSAPKGGADIANSIYSSLTLADSLETLVALFESDGIVPTGWGNDYDFMEMPTIPDVDPYAEKSLMRLNYSIATPTPEPTATPSPSPSPLPTPTTEPTPTIEPTAIPTIEPTAEPSPVPTIEPTVEPSPTETPVSPTSEPTATPTDEPTPIPTAIPTDVPTVTPVPTEQPPIPTPTIAPAVTPIPTSIPVIPPVSIPPTDTSSGSSSNASSVPAASPTVTPTIKPTTEPSKAPTASPVPTKRPTVTPKPSATPKPSIVPTNKPTTVPKVTASSSKGSNEAYETSSRNASMNYQSSASQNSTDSNSDDQSVLVESYAEQITPEPKVTAPAEPGEQISLDKNVKIISNGADCVFEVNNEGYTITINAEAAPVVGSNLVTEESDTSYSWLEIVKVGLLFGILMCLLGNSGIVRRFKGANIPKDKE